MNIPILNDKYICIADRGNMNLSSTISSYLQQNGAFLSIFEFPSATIEKPKYLTEVIDENSMSRIRSEQLSVQINNAINKIGGCICIVLAGLDDNQKSYLSFLDEFEIIEIDSIDEVESYLGGIAYDKETLNVSPDEILQGLYQAGRKGCKMCIDDGAEPLKIDSLNNSGLIIIENNETTSSISGVNYALSLNADIKIINSLSPSELGSVGLLIEDWQKGNQSSYNELEIIMSSRICNIDFSQYDYVTFFTEGVPYSLIMKNLLPISYVHLNQYPNLFIVDNIFYEQRGQIGSSVIFSPLEFGTDEETEFVMNIFKDNNYWVRELTGKEASAYNIDMHVKEYPFDILHICSHGGEVNGYSVTEKFLDRDGNQHVVEYDDVISFYPGNGQDLIKVEMKHIWRKFNGLSWKSKELEEKHYSNYVFSDMLNAIISKSKLKQKYNGTPKPIVTDSCSVKCSDFIFQAAMEMVAGFHTSPIIFNNTCWSWSGIAESFLNSGVRGYIGTLWGVNNDVARLTAEDLYKNIFEETVLNSLHKANSNTKGTKSEDIYIYWGLHFSTLKRLKSTENSKLNIANCLFKSFMRWHKGILTMSDGSVKENSMRLAEWNRNVLIKKFPKELRKNLIESATSIRL